MVRMHSLSVEGSVKAIVAQKKRGARMLTRRPQRKYST